MAELPRGFERILVCQQHRIGDVLLATPSVRLLKAAYPGAAIHFLTEKGCAPVLAHNPDIERVWTIDKKAQDTLWRQLSFAREVAGQGFDLVVDFQQLPRLRWAVLFSHAPVRLTYTPPWYNRLFYTHWTDMTPGYAAMAKASVLRPLGISWKGEKPRLYLTDAERAFAREFLAAHGVQPGEMVVTVDPSHRRATRCWPAGHFAGLIDRLATHEPSARFVLLAGPGEERVIEEVRAVAGCKDQIILPERILSLREMAAVIAAAGLHLGTCSAPRHFAVALDTPTFVVLGSTSQAWTFPGPEHAAASLGLDCQPCNKNECPHGEPRCLKDLTPDLAMERLAAFLRPLTPRRFA